MKQGAARKHGLTYVGHPRRAEKTGAWSRAQEQYPGKERIVIEVIWYIWSRKIGRKGEDENCGTTQKNEGDDHSTFTIRA